MPVPSLQQSIDLAEAARRRQIATIAARIRVSPNVAAVMASHAFGVPNAWSGMEAR